MVISLPNSRKLNALKQTNPVRVSGSDSQSGPHEPLRPLVDHETERHARFPDGDNQIVAQTTPTKHQVGVRTLEHGG